jgi:hypothetical protein
MDTLNPEYNIMRIAGYLSGIRKERGPMSEEQKLKLSEKKGPDHHCFGKPRTEEELTKMRNNHPRTRKVYQYAEDRKTFIAEFPSLREMTKKINITRDYVVRCIKEDKLVHDKYYF